METQPLCPKCRSQISHIDNFCSYCGENLKAKPLALSKHSIILVSAITILFPPLGLIWAVKYVRTPDEKFKKFGWAIIIMTVLSTIITLWLSWFALDSIKNSYGLNEQLDSLGY